MPQCNSSNPPEARVDLPSGERPGQPDNSVRMVMGAMLGLIVVIVGFLSSYASALGKPDAREIPTAVSAAPTVRGELDASPLLKVHSVPDITPRHPVLRLPGNRFGAAVPGDLGRCWTRAPGRGGTGPPRQAGHSLHGFHSWAKIN